MHQPFSRPISVLQFVCSKLLDHTISIFTTIFTHIFCVYGYGICKDNDTMLSAEKRDIGGLGIYMVKKSMDDITYEYKDGQNILTIKKKLS